MNFWILAEADKTNNTKKMDENAEMRAAVKAVDSATAGSRVDKTGTSRASSKMKKTRELIKASDEKVQTPLERIGDFFVPIVALFVFVLIVIFVYLPFSTEMMDTKREADLLEEEISQNNAKIAALSSLSVSDLDRDLAMVESVVRNKMDVSELAEQVEDLAVKNGLRPLDIAFSDSVSYASDSDVIKSEREVPSFAKSITGPFAFYGEFDDVVRFIGDLRDDSPTILSLGAVTVSRYSRVQDSEDLHIGKELWSVEMVIRGYLTSEVTETNVSDSIKTTLDEELMNEIELRSTGGVRTGAAGGSSGSGSSGSGSSSGDPGGPE